jgi:hypothetical protein
MNPKQLVENVRKYWDQDDPSLVNNSSILKPESNDAMRNEKQKNSDIQNSDIQNRRNSANKQRPATTNSPRRKREILVKDWTYWRKNAYRGGGAIWTDPSVHCPPSRQQFVGRRPDLDALHMAYVNKQIAKEKRKMSRKLKYRTDTKRKQQTRFLKQREMNHMMELGVVNGRPTTAPEINMSYNVPGGHNGGSIEEDQSMQLTPRITMEGNVIKDQKFYRRNGSMWTDYIHTAPDRLHLVLNDKIINADKKAADFIRQRYEDDRRQEEMDELKKIMRTKEMREEFQSKQKYGSKVLKATKLTPCSKRINELARPKTARDAYKEAGPFDGMDFKGLLLTDHTVGPLVQDRVRRNTIKMERKRAGTAPTNRRRRNTGNKNNGSQSARGPRVRTAPTVSNRDSGILNESLSRTNSRKSQRQRPNTAAQHQQQLRDNGKLRPNTAPAFAPNQLHQQYTNAWGDVSLEGVVPSMRENSIVGAMMREAQGTIAELDVFEDRREMLDRRKGYEGPENWFRSDVETKRKKNASPQTNINNNSSSNSIEFKRNSDDGKRPSTAPVNNNRKNNLIEKTKRNAGNYWEFLSTKEDQSKQKTRPSRYSKERMLYNRKKTQSKRESKIINNS